MRVPRLRLTAVLGAIGVLGGALFAAGPAVAAVPTPTPMASLIVNPSEGRPDTQITVEYRLSAKVTSANCPLTVEFTWDGGFWRSRPHAATECVFQLRAAPPDHTPPGPHVIGARGLTSTFTVIGRSATPTPTATLPSPTPGRTTAGPTVPTGDVTDQPAAGVDTSQAAAAPLDSGGSVLGEAAQDSGGGGAISWILIFGGLLVLGGIAIFGLLVYWSRRGGGGGPDPDPDRDPHQDPYPDQGPDTEVYGV